MNIFQETIEFLAKNPELIERVLQNLGEMPNIEAKVMNGGVFWKDIADYNGWRIQENIVTSLCRILDPNDVRKAWGGKSAMEEVFRKLLGD